MGYLKLRYNGNSYTWLYESNIEMCILGNFLTTDFHCGRTGFRDFALNNWEVATNSNITALRKEDSTIYLSDLYSEEEDPTELKMSIE